MLIVLKSLILFGWIVTAGSLTAKNSTAHFLHELKRGKTQKILVYGTSLTANASWPSELEAVLRKSFRGGVNVVNAAKGGSDSRWGLANLETRVLRKRPDTVFIEFAINDALASSRLDARESGRNLQAMIDSIRRELRDCDIVVMIMNPPTGDALQQRAQIRQYERRYREIAKINSCRLIDFSRQWRSMISNQPSSWRSYVPDGLHPNRKAGHEVIVPFLLDKIGFSGLNEGNQTAREGI